jgi:sterol desaturase/sphingolipid hydroxylase (fatty acid hydroxylase superfamily)
MDTHNINIVAAIPVFLLLLLAEYLYMRKKNPAYIRMNDMITNINIGAGQVLTKLLAGLFLFQVYGWVYSFRLVSMPDTIWAYLLTLVVFDFLFYWAHRWGHEINFFWGAHGVHHQSEDYNLSVALRQSWIHAIIAFVIFLPMPFFLGISPKVFFISLSINSFYQFWIHTDVIQRMPKWFEFIFNSPAHHRVHHGRDVKYIDKNHAGMFIFWDKMFGTFQEEEEKPNYGITKPLNSWNPFWANVEYYAGMVKLAQKMSRWRDKLFLLIAKPGWQPQELGGMMSIPEVEKGYQKYDAKPRNLGLNLYVLVQFLLIMAGIMAFLYHYENLPLFYKYFGFCVLMLSTLSCSGILEQKKWVPYVEIGRLLLIGFGLNTLYYQSYTTWFYIVLIISIVLVAYFIAWFILSLHNKRLILMMVEENRI